MRTVFVLSLIGLLILSAISLLVIFRPGSGKNEKNQFYVGVTFSGNTTAEATRLIDRVKTSTNLFVLQSGPISKNETVMNEICDYAVAAGLHIIVYFGWFDVDHLWQVPWLDFAKKRWGDRLLGVYYYDEPGGIQIDYNWLSYFEKIKQGNSTQYQIHAPEIEGYLNGSLPKNYDSAAQMYVDAVETAPGLEELKSRSITVFTSDYALYWFDYLGGYDVVLAQFGWNHSLVQDIALVRGAAQMQNKTWGVIITWKYRESPYLDNGEEIYRQMKMAYEAGAKYVIIFNYPKINDYGILTDDHFEALGRFWKEVVRKPHVVHGAIEAKAAFVLPRNYGWGMRHCEDRIWYWGPDEKSIQIWELSRSLLEQYGLSLDIIYDDPKFPVNLKYEQTYYLNPPDLAKTQDTSISIYVRPRQPKITNAYMHAVVLAKKISTNDSSLIDIG